MLVKSLGVVVGGGGGAVVEAVDLDEGTAARRRALVVIDRLNVSPRRRFCFVRGDCECCQLRHASRIEVASYQVFATRLRSQSA